METMMSRFELEKAQVLQQKEAFDALDVDGSGSITFNELKKVNQAYKGGFSDDELREQFKELDVDGSGEITFWEFLKVYVKGKFGRDVSIPQIIDTRAVEDLEPGRRRSMSHGETSNLEPIAEESLTKVEMKLSKKNSTGFYIRAATNFLKGTGERKPVNDLKLTALGEAINSAIAVAANIEKQGLGTILKVSTAYPDMPNGRGCAQIAIDVKRSASAE
mmetsp:Transcript_110201/g.152472  ORF Transcript_110201/g.152472 Transcript_110201/m.152472 type:complete len:219 (-) Transcript_110201:35-691(-)